VKKIKLITIVGARPQFIKAAAFSKIAHQRGQIEEEIVHTGQHYDSNMSDIFFEELKVPRPRFQLEIKENSHGAQTGKMLVALEQILLQEKPDAVLVYGDTNSTLAGALAATKLHIPVFHVEAGLRSFNRKMPEEINRIVTDSVADLLFCPTDVSVQQLKKEGVADKKIIYVGDIMYDVALGVKASAEDISRLRNRFGLSKNFILATVHRAENTNDPVRFYNIIQALDQIAEKTDVLLPLHPRSQQLLNAENRRRQTKSPNLKIVEPLGYFDMQVAEQAAQLIVTDSGGVQKEAYFHKKLCLTLRDQTEWTELVNAGWNELCDTLDPLQIQSKITAQLTKRPPDKTPSFYGNGDAAQLIHDGIVNYFMTPPRG
jgi:UDP-GlcNAc3NAcA epimerase